MRAATKWVTEGIDRNVNIDRKGVKVGNFGAEVLELQVFSVLDLHRSQYGAENARSRSVNVRRLQGKCPGRGMR